MRNCTVCDQRLPSEETYFCPNCGSALVQNKLITERTTLNYDPLSMYFKPWKEKVNLPKRNHNNSGNGKNSGSMKQPWIPTMRQLRVVKPSATQLEKKLMQKTDFFCDDLKISNNKKNKRMKIVFTSVLDLLRVSEIPEMKDGVSKSVLDKAWTKQTLLDQIVIKRLDLYPLQERIYPVAVYEGNWLAVPHVLINLSLVEQIVGPKRMYWLRLGIVIDELLEDLTKDIVAASNRTSTSNQECTRNDTTNNDSESSNHDGRDINNFRNAEDNAMGEDDSRAEENVVHTLEGSNRVDVQKDCIEFDEKDINNCEQGDGIDVMEKNSNQIASKDDNNTNNNDEEMKQNKLEVIAVLSNEVARMIHDNSHDWVPLSAIDPMEFYMSQHMQKILHSIASKVTFGSSLKHSVTVLKSESNDRTDEANGGNSSDLQRHDQKEYELIQHYSVRAVYEDTSKISDEAREQEEFISKLKEFETVEEEAQREVDFQALLGSAPPVSKKKLKLTETIKQFQNLPVQLSLIKEDGTSPYKLEERSQQDEVFHFGFNDCIGAVTARIKLQNCSSISSWVSQVRMTVTYGNRIDTKDSDISECVLSDFEQSCSISHINLSVYPAGSATGEFNDQRMILLPASIHVKFDVGAMRLLVDPFFSMDKLLAKEHNRKPNAVRTDNKNKDLDTKIFVEISQVKSRILSPINTIHSEIDSASGLGKICTYYEDTTTNIATRNDINKVIRKLVSLLRLEHTSNGVVVSVIGTIPTIAYQTTPWPNSGTSNVKFGRPAWMLDYDSDEDFRSDSNACFDDDAAKDDTIVGSSDQLEERGSDFEE